MDTEQSKTDLKVEVKARVPRKLKRRVEALARHRMVSASDILRSALLDFVRRNTEAA